MATKTPKPGFTAKAIRITTAAVPIIATVLMRTP